LCQRPRKQPQELRNRVMRLVQKPREEDPEFSLNPAVVRIRHTEYCWEVLAIERSGIQTLLSSTFRTSG
jgi:hypothetical protein